MPSVKGTLTIASGASKTSTYFNKQHYAGMLLVRLPSGIQGIVAVRVSDRTDMSGGRCYDLDGNLIQINPTGKTLPAWFPINTDIFPAHYVWFETYTDATEATAQTQSADREIRVMGIYSE